MANFAMGVSNLIERGRQEFFNEELKEKMMKFVNKNKGVTWQNAQKFTKNVFNLELGNITTMPKDINKVLTKGEMYSLIIDIVDGYTSRA